jgi:GTP-binding protein
MNLNNSLYIKSVLSRRDKPTTTHPEVVIIGRSNVGKSSLINTVVQRKNLAKTSSTPGKTRLINYFLIDHKLYLVDLPGYGYIHKKDSVSRKWDDLLGDFLLKNRQIKLVLVLIDSRHPEMNADRYSITWLRHNQIPFVIILTKSDKVSKNENNSVQQKMNFLFPGIKIIPFSAKKGTGREEIIHLLEHCAGVGNRQKYPEETVDD